MVASAHSCERSSGPVPAGQTLHSTKGSREGRPAARSAHCCPALPALARRPFLKLGRVPLPTAAAGNNANGPGVRPDRKERQPDAILRQKQTLFQLPPPVEGPRSAKGPVR